MKTLTRVLFATIISISILTSCKDDDETNNNLMSTELSIDDFDMWWFGDPADVDYNEKFATIYIGDLKAKPGIKISYFKKQDSPTSPTLFLMDEIFDSYSASKKDGKVIFEDAKTKEVILTFEEMDFNGETKTAIIELKYNDEIIKMTHRNQKVIEL